MPLTRRVPYTRAMDRLWTPWRYSYVTGERHEGERKGVPEALNAWPDDRGCVFCNMIGAVDWAVSHGTAETDAFRAAFVLERAEHCFLTLNGFPYNNGRL